MGTQLQAVNLQKMWSQEESHVLTVTIEWVVFLSYGGLSVFPWATQPPLKASSGLSFGLRVGDIYSWWAP